ncbi:hypothetical protein TNCV_4403881 [Trichonephila clavipes]|uniref:Uncharacterized protein n=1 Tax=Trichonephila clavipes TaxID=2585209 RepID=A0A8X6SC24_TRICX|nr:hypothetical protein TNCV_4403881 [Trichonephila clavipes]
MACLPTIIASIEFIYSSRDQTRDLGFKLQPQEAKLPVRLINTTNERRLVQGHETIPLRVKGDIEDVFSELDNEG